MDCIMELNQDELLMIDGGGFLKAVAYAGTSWAAAALSSACYGAITVAAPAIVTAGCITGGLGFGAVALFCAGGAIISLFN